MTKILVTGATGYIGGRLVPLLTELGHEVVCLVRNAKKMHQRPWASSEHVSTFEHDLSDRYSLVEGLQGCEVAYYLIHAMEAAGEDFHSRDLRNASNFAHAAKEAGVERIIYLGGLGEMGVELSEHLRSRQEVESALKSTGIPLTALRAAMIIGSGSASFEILRYLVERLPVMITPKWVQTQCQPIAVSNVLQYLCDCLSTPSTVGKTLDIGGPDVMPYTEVMQATARVLGLSRRLIIQTPFLTPKVSSLWIHLITPVSHRIARPLAEGLRNRVVCRDDEAQRLMPQRLLGVEEAIRRSLELTENDAIQTAWYDAGPMAGDPVWSGGTVFLDRRELMIFADGMAVYDELTRLGGENGWHSPGWLWQLRGWMDRLVGGPGHERGKRSQDHVGYGDVLDFWRVVEADPGKRLGLRAEMKLPGRALLQFDIVPEPGEGRVRLIQTAKFQPRGLAGLAYWYAVTPFHGLVFNAMINGIRQSVEKRAKSVLPGAS